MNGATGAAGGGAGTGSPLPEARDGRPPQPHHPPQAYPPPQSPPALPPAPVPQQGQAPGQYEYDYAAGPGGPGARRPRPAARQAPPRTRKARLRVAKADPWSVMKVSAVLSIALGICTIVAVAVLWLVMDALGVFSTVGATLSDATGSGSSSGFDLQSFLSLPRVMMFTAGIAGIDVVLATALATLASLLYNLSTGFVGGIELTLAEDE